MNPFDEIAVEEAIRLKERGVAIVPAGDPGDAARRIVAEARQAA